MVNDFLINDFQFYIDNISNSRVLVKGQAEKAQVEKELERAFRITIFSFILSTTTFFTSSLNNMTKNYWVYFGIGRWQLHWDIISKMHQLGLIANQSLLRKLRESLCEKFSKNGRDWYQGFSFMISWYFDLGWAHIIVAKWRYKTS